jgi:hypothetical protein
VSVRHGQVSTSPLAFIHPPNQPLKESSWGMSLVQSALRANCWPHNQPGKVKGLAHSPWLYGSGLNLTCCQSLAMSHFKQKGPLRGYDVVIV